LFQTYDITNAMPLLLLGEVIYRFERLLTSAKGHSRGLPDPPSRRDLYKLLDRWGNRQFVYFHESYSHTGLVQTVAFPSLLHAELALAV